MCSRGSSTRPTPNPRIPPWRPPGWDRSTPERKLLRLTGAWVRAQVTAEPEQFPLRAVEPSGQPRSAYHPEHFPAIVGDPAAPAWDAGAMTVTKTTLLSPADQERRRGLRLMKGVALGALIAMALLFI